MAARPPRPPGVRISCAACKHQRRRCVPDCPLAPYFPANQPAVFQNANRLFGISKILRLLERLDDPYLRNEAMRSIVYQANARALNPVHGSVAIIYDLWFRIMHAERTLAVLNSQLNVLRHCHQNQQALMLGPPATLDMNIVANNNQASSSGSYSNHPQINNNNALALFPVHADRMTASGDHQTVGGGHGMGSGADPNLFWVAQHCMQVPYTAAYNNVETNASQLPSGAAVAQSSFVDPSQQGNPMIPSVTGYGDVSPYLDNTVDGHRSIATRDACESSHDKDTMKSNRAE